MADTSSFMDWSPPTPEPPFNPYHGDCYIPGGWPADRPASQGPTADVFAAQRPPPSGFMPAAKRLCGGISAALAYTFATATTVSRYSVGATTAIVAVPTYYIVRQVQQRRSRLGRSQRQRRQHLLLPPISDSPWNRASASAESTLQRAPSTSAVPQTTPVPVPSPPRIAAALPPSTPHPWSNNILYRVPDLMPTSRAGTVNHAHRPIAHPRRRRHPSSPVLPGMPRFTPPTRQTSLQSQATPIPIGGPHLPLPECGRLQIPYPQLQPVPATPPSSDPSIIAVTISPSDQLQGEPNAAQNSDSDTSSTYSDTWRPRKRQMQQQGAASPEGTQTPTIAKRVCPRGPSVASPKSPTPALFVQETSPPANEPAACTNTNLLSPPRFRRRPVSTPPSSKRKTLPEPHTPQTQESDVSSMRDICPRYGREGRNMEAKSPNESDLSSTCNFSPPDPNEDARLLGMTMAGGGSPTPETKPTLTTAPALAEGAAVSDKILLPAPSNTDTQSNFTASQRDAADTPSSQTTIPQSLESENSSTRSQHESLHAQTVDAGESSASSPQISETVPPQTPSAQSVGLTNEALVRTNLGSFQTTENRLAQLSLEDQFTPDQPTPKAAPHSSEKKQRVTRAETKRLQALEELQHYEISPLTEEWNKKVQVALRNGHGTLKASDLTRVVPLVQGRSTDNWLNDEVINEYLKLIVKHGRQNDRPTQVPTHHAFSSFFFNNLESRGYESVKRWATRAKIGGKNLLETDNVFIPINSGMHWTLCVVSGKNKTIAHYNSLGGNGRRYIETVKKWVREELGSSYKEEEWRMEYVGESPQQQNMDDCGVFTITNARQIMLGLTPMSYTAGQIPLQRRRIVAELVNDGLIKSTEAYE